MNLSTLIERLLYLDDIFYLDRALLLKTFLPREYAKSNERVIADDGKFTHSLTRSLARSITQL